MKQNFNIPKGKTQEDINIRKRLIKDYYATWNSINTSKHVYNKHLNDFISVKFLSIQETSLIAALSYESTMAVTFLTEILEKAKITKIAKPKTNNKNQKRFSEIILMQYDKKNFGVIKLTVGVLRNSRQNVQYCITAIKKD